MALQPPCCRRCMKQKIKVFGVHGAARNEPGCAPALGGCFTVFGVLALVVVADDELLEDAIELRDGQSRRGDGCAVGTVRDVSREGGQ